jgi:hypothetical protein
LVGILLLALVGCAPGDGAGLQPIAPQTAVVGVELAVTLRADASHARFAFASDLDMHDRTLVPTLTPYANGEALFRWTPLASDFGAHAFRFTASADGAASSQTVAIDVVAGADPISFRSPVGDGTTLDLGRAPCVEVPLLVDDTSATAVTLGSDGALPAGATITSDGALAGELRFCPPQSLAAAQTIFPFTLVATDDGGARAEKRYTIVLGTVAVAPPVAPPTPPSCDPSAPAITTTPHGNITTVGNPHVTAEVSAAHAVAGATVYWSTDAPADATMPDLSVMNAVALQLLSGTTQDGQWGGTIPSPVIDDAPGTSATIYYVIVATDDDDSIAGCPAHTTDSPLSGVYSFVIKEAN